VQASEIHDNPINAHSAIYDAFISYSHLRDKPIATALQRAVQTLGKPWYRRRALRIFCDDTSLSATPSLWPSIERALEQSRYFILLASPEAATSKWVNKEVAFWIEHNSVEKLLIGVTEGELHWSDDARDFIWDGTTALPPVLRGQLSDEPRWIDLRPFRNGASLRDHKFEEIGVDFAAAIRGIPKEDLLSEEVRQQRRALMLTATAACSLLILVGAVAWKWNEATEAERRAVKQRDRAEKTLAATTNMANDLVMDVAVKIRNRLGIPVYLARDILTRSHDLLGKLLEAGEISPDLRHGIAVTLRELATTSLMQGDISTALEVAEQSRDVMLGLLAENSENPKWLRELSLSYNRIGETLSRSARRGDALKAFQLAFELRQKLAELEQENPEAQRDLAVSYERVGDELFAAGKTDEATESYESAMEIRQELTASSPEKKEWARDLSVSYEKMGDVSFVLEHFDAALDHYALSLEMRTSLAGLDQTGAAARRDLAISLAKIGDVHAKLGHQEPAVTAYKNSLAIRNQLATTDPGNVGSQADLIVILIKLGDSGDDPRERYTRAIEIARRLDAEGKLAAEQKGWVAELERRLLQP
jgi:tetratricopeptide (TPR) repeat protein